MELSLLINDDEHDVDDDNDDGDDDVDDGDDEDLLLARRDLWVASGHPETLRWELLFLFLCPRPSQPGVGQRRTFSFVTTTFGGTLSRLGQPDRLRWWA